MLIFSDITEKERIEEMYSTYDSKIWPILQHDNSQTVRDTMYASISH